LSVASRKAASRKIAMRYKKPHIARSVAESIQQERTRAAKEAAAKKRNK